MSAIRDYFSSYDPPRGGDFFGPRDDPPEIQPPQPVSPPSVNHGAKAAFRANKIRDYLAQNPSRRPGPMGRNPDGSINWDTSTGIGAAGAAGMGRNATYGTITGSTRTGNAPAASTGAFNAAIPQPDPSKRRI